MIKVKNTRPYSECGPTKAEQFGFLNLNSPHFHALSKVFSIPESFRLYSGDATPVAFHWILPSFAGRSHTKLHMQRFHPLRNI